MWIKNFNKEIFSIIYKNWITVLFFTSKDWMFVSPQNSYIEMYSLNIMVFGDEMIRSWGQNPPEWD